MSQYLRKKLQKGRIISCFASGSRATLHFEEDGPLRVPARARGNVVIKQDMIRFQSLAAVVQEGMQSLTLYLTRASNGR